jgi:hypothetical protein
MLPCCRFQDRGEVAFRYTSTYGDCADAAAANKHMQVSRKLKLKLKLELKLKLYKSLLLHSIQRCN